MKVKHIHTCTVSVVPIVECKCFQFDTAIVCSLSHGTVLHSSCGSTRDSWSWGSTARRGRRLPCSRADNAAAQLEMERWPPALKKRRVVKPTMDEQYTHALCNWVATLEAPPEDLPQAKRPGWWRHGMSLFAERSAPTDGAEAVAAAAPVKTKRAYHQPSRDLRLWVVDYALLRHLQGWDNRMIADHLAAWLPHVFRPWLSTRTLRRWLDENKKEGRDPRDAVDAIMPILREKCDRVGEAGVPVSASVMQPIFNRVADQHGMARRFSKHWIYHFLRCAGFKYRVASGGIKKTTDPKLMESHVDKLRLRLMYYVTEYGVHPSCIMNMDETAAKLLGLGHRGWARPNQDGRVRFIGAADKRNLTISTVVTMTGTIMAQLIVEGTTKRVVQDLLQHEKLSYTFSESHWCTESTCQELIEWLGDWVRKQGFLHWVLLWDCASVHRKASLLEWIRTAHPECHVLFIPGGYTAELQPADIAIQQPLKHSIKQQAMQFFAESVCRNEAVLDLRLSTMKRLLAHWVLHACAEVEKNPSITTKAWRHLSWTFEEAPRLAARATREHLDGTLFDETEVEQEEPPEEEDLILHDDDDDDDGAEDPENTGTALAEASAAVADGSTAVAEASESFPTVAAEVARAERFLYLRCAYGKHPPKP